MNRVARTLSTILATLGLALLVPASTIAAADCSLSASPRTGAPGTEFVFRGEGFSPTTLSLTRGDDAAVVVDVSDAVDESFRFALVAQDTDVGRWSAVAAGCEDTTSIRVTLPPTTTADTSAMATAPDETAELAGMTLLGVLFLGATALLIPRLTRAARSR
jgi:hypothetical protein